MKLRHLFLLLLGMVFAIPGMAQDVLYVSRSSRSTINPTTVADPTTDARLIPTGKEGVYQGQFSLLMTQPFIFYKVVDEEIVWCGRNSDLDSSTFLMGSDFTDGKAVINLTEGSPLYWFLYGQLPEGCDGNFDVTVDFNAGTATLTALEAKAPENIYVWYSEQGPEAARYFNKTFTMKPTADGHIFEGEFWVPQIEGFTITDPETGTTEMGHGMYFYLSDNAANYIGNGITTYTVSPEAQIINLPKAGESFEATLLTDKSGVPLVAENPGLVKMTFNWETNRFTATMLQPGIREKDLIYVATGTNYYSVSAKDGDPGMELNEETGWYEGVTISAPAKNYAWKFYKKDADGNITYFGPISATSINFQSVNPYTASYLDAAGKPDFGSSSTWRASNYLPDASATTGEIALAINLSTGSVRFEQVNIPELIPSAFYLWGSENGPGTSYRNYGTLMPDKDNPELYELVFDVPEVHTFDQESGDEVNFFLFSIGNSASSYAPNTMFNAEYATEGNPTTFEFEQSGASQSVKLYLGTVAPNGNPISSMREMTPGETLFSFNYKTGELTLTYLGEPSGQNYVTFDFTGMLNAYKYVEAVDLLTGDDIKLADDVYTYYYDSMGAVVLSPIEGYAIEITCTTEGLTQGTDYTINGLDMDDTMQYTVGFNSAASEANFKVEVTETSATGTNTVSDGVRFTVTDINGIVLLRDATPADLHVLGNGVYVVNGKKIIIRK